MSTSATTGNGTVLSHSTTSGGVYTALAEIVDVKMPKVKVGKAEATHYTSPSNTKEFIPVPWKEYEDIAVKLNYEKSQTVTINALVAVASWWKVAVADGSTWSFPGFVSEFGGEIPNQGKVEQDMMLTITGPVTFAAGA